MNKYKTLEELKEELGDKYDKFMYDMNLELVKQKEKEQQKLERYKNIVDELEKDILDYFKKEYPDRKIEDYNLKNCTYDYALVILDKLKELKGSDS